MIENNNDDFAGQLQRPRPNQKAEFQKILQEIEEAVAAGGRGGEFIRRAYLSYYRQDVPVNLIDAVRLDGRNYNLLCRMLRIRQMSDWSDWEMFQLEQRLKLPDVESEE